MTTANGCRAGLGVVLVLALAACGGGKSPRVTAADVLRHPAAGDVSVSFCDLPQCGGEATPAEEHAVEKRIQRGTCVNQVVFVSKNLALAYLEKKNPSLASSPQGPPALPDEVVVIPSKSSCAASIAAGLKAAHLRGVDRVQVVRALNAAAH